MSRVISNREVKIAFPYTEKFIIIVKRYDPAKGDKVYRIPSDSWEFRN